MIHGIGTDIVAVARLRRLWERHGERAVGKLLSDAERADFATASDKGRFLAKRFAAKEAFAKAMGTGLRGPVQLPSISVVHNSIGKPGFAFSDELSLLLRESSLVPHLSISDEIDYAIAYVILERP